jgi:hypothetical protein
MRMIERRRERWRTREWCRVASRTVPHSRVSLENSITKISVEEHDFFRYKHDMPPPPRSTMNTSLQHIHVGPHCAALRPQCAPRAPPASRFRAEPPIPIKRDPNRRRRSVMHTSRVSSPRHSASRVFFCLETAELYSSPTRLHSATPPAHFPLCHRFLCHSTPLASTREGAALPDDPRLASCSTRSLVCITAGGGESFWKLSARTGSTFTVCRPGRRWKHAVSDCNRCCTRGKHQSESPNHEHSLPQSLSCPRLSKSSASNLFYSPCGLDAFSSEW